jgi:ATP-dependent Clp protease protease subunit
MSAIDPGPGSDPFGRGFGGSFERDAAEWMRAQLWERRVVALVGRLDDTSATTVAAELMALDAGGDEAIILQVDCSGGAVQSALTVIDTIDLLGVPVRARCVGRADGVAAGIVAVAHHRGATPHARFRLTVPDVSLGGSASVVEANARENQREMECFVSRIANATGRAFEHVEADLERGRWLDAEEALTYGLIDEIEQPDPGGRGSDRPKFGFA